MSRQNFSEILRGGCKKHINSFGMVLARGGVGPILAFLKKFSEKFGKSFGVVQILSTRAYGISVCLRSPTASIILVIVPVDPQLGQPFPKK